MIAYQETGARDRTASRYANADNATRKAAPSTQPRSTGVQAAYPCEERNSNRILNQSAEAEKRDGERAPDSKKCGAHRFGQIVAQPRSGGFQTAAGALEKALLLETFVLRPSSEKMRAHDCGEGSSEDLTTPGTFEFDLSNRPSVLIFSMENHDRSQGDQHVGAFLAGLMQNDCQSRTDAVADRRTEEVTIAQFLVA